MISTWNLNEGIDQIMSFCRGREELSSEQNTVQNTYIYCKVMIILLILSENFYITLFCKKQKYSCVLAMFDLLKWIEIVCLE